MGECGSCPDGPWMRQLMGSMAEGRAPCEGPAIHLQGSLEACVQLRCDECGIIKNEKIYTINNQTIIKAQLYD